MASQVISLISIIIGWVYSICWSVSFYPQAWLNFRRKSVTGLSIDFVVISIIGFFCYSVYTVSFYFVPAVQEEYRQRHQGQDNLIALNDVIFALHALVLTSLYGVQVILYKKKDEGMSRLGAIAGSSTCVLIAVLAGLCAVNKFFWLDFVYIMSYLKLITTVLKYIPQVYMNYALKSTIGWNIQNTLMDFVGGVLSITQLFMDAFNNNDINGIKGTSAKLILGLVSIVFDIIFMMQHYVWYREPSHQRVIVAASGKNSELASPVSQAMATPKSGEANGSGSVTRKGSPFRTVLSVEELEAQRNTTDLGGAK